MATNQDSEEPESRLVPYVLVAQDPSNVPDIPLWIEVRVSDEGGIESVDISDEEFAEAEEWYVNHLVEADVITQEKANEVLNRDDRPGQN